jgi:hypothetical protein
MVALQVITHLVALAAPAATAATLPRGDSTARNYGAVSNDVPSPPTPPPATPRPPATLSPPQLLAAHQYTVNFEWLANHSNRAYVDQMPFDGITIRFKNATKGGPQSVHSNYSVDETQLLATMMAANLRTLQNVTANWVAINAGVTPPFSNWSEVVVPNYRKLARSAKAAGLSGIYLDTEDYGAEGGSRCVWWSNRVAGGHMCVLYGASTLHSSPDHLGCVI